MAALRRLMRLSRRVAVEFVGDHCPHQAAAISYYVLFSLFPLLIFLVGIGGLVLQDEGLQSDLIDSVVDFIPLSEDEGRNEVTDAVRAISRGRAGTIGLAGLLAMAWSATNMFGAIARSLNIAYDVDVSRPYLRQKLVDLGLMLAIGPFFLLSIFATGVIAFARDGVEDLGRVGDHVASAGNLWFLAGATVSAGFSFLAFLILYWLVPAAKLGPKDVWPGALVAAVLFEVAKAGFSFYLANFSNFDLVFGSLGAVVTFLFWVYVSSNILLLGAEIASEYPRVMAGEFDAPRVARPPVPLRRRAWRLVRGLMFRD